MDFARKVWRLLVGIKDGLVLLFMLLFFFALYGVMTARPSPGAVREGALLVKLDGTVVEEPAPVDPFSALVADETPTREYRARDVVRAIRGAAQDSRIKAVVLDLSRFTGGGFVHMQDIAAAMDAVRAAKKPVFVWAVGYADDALLLAAHSSESWVDPMGGAFVTGPGGHNLYFGRLLEKLKVNAHIYRVGTYKDFVEPYYRNDQSPEARAARQALFGAMFEQWQANVAKARPKADLALVTTDPVAWLKGAGGDAAKAALSAGLIDRVGSRVDFGKRVAAVVGEDTLGSSPGGFAHTTLRAWLDNAAPKAPGKAIGVITVAGEIVDGKAEAGTAGGDRIADLLDDALDDDLAGLVVRVDSPGGSVMASEAIRAAILRHKAKGIPIAVSMANVAASGGYWVSTPAQRIFAEPGTITGSIGIFAVIPSFERALADWGVTGDGVRTTPLSGQPDILTGLTPEVEAMLQANVENGYGRFIGLVGAARGKSIADVDKIAQGRVWDGGTARQIGLVDQFGGLDDATAWVAGKAGLKAGDWHPVYLGEDANPYASLIERLQGDDDGAPPAEASDLAGMVAGRQQDAALHALDQFRRLMSVRGAQALCLECPAPRGRASGKDASFWLRIARWTGLVPA